MTRTQPPRTNRGMSHLTSFLAPFVVGTLIVALLGGVVIGTAIHQPTPDPQTTYTYSYDYNPATNQLVITYDDGPTVTQPQYVATSTTDALGLHEPGDTVTGTAEPGETIQLWVMNDNDDTGVLVDTYTVPGNTTNNTTTSNQ